MRFNYLGNFLLLLYTLLFSFSHHQVNEEN
jgi:hypothetical protein